MEDIAINNRNPGFWVRFAAVWIDVCIVWMVIKLFVKIFSYLDIYIPLELTVVLTLTGYSSLFIGWKGHTIGKMICGLTVRTTNDQPLWYLRAFYRESICKAISAIFVFWGFFRVAITRKKCAWHDDFAHTIVVYHRSVRRSKVVLSLILSVSAVFVGMKTLKVALVYRDANRLAVEPDIINTHEQRAQSSLLDVSALEPNDQLVFAEWLNENGLDPLEYAVQTARNHDVTIFGETHNKREYLMFLNRIIPELYHRAGITCIAMEVYQSEDNERLYQLVTSNQFDKALKMQIARNVTWKAWGCKGYWDVLETVWRLNRSLPEGSKKMRVIGLSYNWDGPSWHLVRSGPIWERLRVFRVLDDFVLMLKADGIYARIIEKEIIKKGEKGIVWVGVAHSDINYRLRQKYARMGFMLHHKYGNRIFQIKLHDPYRSESIAALIEHVVKDPVGFDVTGSPFGFLRDDDSFYFHDQPNVCFSDMASGYIFLKRFNKLNRCAWLNGYISKEMFVKNKPFYEALCGRKLRDFREANEFTGKRGISNL